MYIEIPDVRVETTALTPNGCAIDPNARIAIGTSSWGVRMNVGTDNTMAMAYLNLHQALALIDMLSEAVIEVRRDDWAVNGYV